MHTHRLTYSIQYYIQAKPNIQNNADVYIFDFMRTLARCSSTNIQFFLSLHSHTNFNTKHEYTHRQQQEKNETNLIKSICVHIEQHETQRKKSNNISNKQFSLAVNWNLKTYFSSINIRNCTNIKSINNKLLYKSRLIWLHVQLLLGFD